MREGTTALLPTGKKYNPAARTGYYSDPSQVAYVLRGVDGPNFGYARVATSFGSVGWTVGQYIEAHHDQTLRSLGRFQVMGVSAPDHVDGEVPDYPITHWVFK